MKKFLALLTAMCMAVMVLAGCGSNAKKHYSTKLGFIEDLCRAIDNDDDDKIKDIQDEIKDWKKEIEDKYDELEDYSDEYEDSIEDLRDEYDDDDFSEAYILLSDGMEYFYEIDEDAISVSEAKKMVDTVFDALEDVVKALDDRDDDKAKDMAKDFKKDMREMAKKYDEQRDKYEDALDDLRDEYDEETVSKALRYYSEA